MFKRKQQEVSDSSKHWYQDKYQNVLTQRNILGLVAIVALLVALAAVFAVMRLAPLKTVEPYLLQIDEKTGITQRVDPIVRDQYAASQAVDFYFTTMYLRLRESYNVATLYQNYDALRLMSAREVFYGYRRSVDASQEGSTAKRLGAAGRRDIKIRSMAYITAGPSGPKSKIIQARFSTSESLPNAPDRVDNWVATITFEYADLPLNQEEQWLNPLGYTVTSYQILPETN